MNNLHAYDIDKIALNYHILCDIFNVDIRVMALEHHGVSNG